MIINNFSLLQLRLSPEEPLEEVPLLMEEVGGGLLRVLLDALRFLELVADLELELALEYLLLHGLLVDDERLVVQLDHVERLLVEVAPLRLRLHLLLDLTDPPQS